MALIHANVFDAALSYIKTNANEAQVRDASSVELVGSIALNSGNFTGPAAYSSGSDSGRKIEALTSDSSDMKNIAVTNASGGSAAKIALVNTSGSGTDLIVASIASGAVALGASDAVNLSTFDIILKDPA